MSRQADHSRGKAKQAGGAKRKSTAKTTRSTAAAAKIARIDSQLVRLLQRRADAVLAAQRRPDLFHAVIGSGQMVSQSVTDRIVWRDLLAQAQATGDWALYDRVLTLGEPPYRDVP